MHSTFLRFWPALIGSLFIFIGAAFAQQDSNQALLDLLVRKGVITAQDVANMKQELAGTKVPPPAVAPPAPATEPTALAVAVVKTELAHPLSFKIGGADFTPFGFVDFTTVYRSTNVGSGISTNFAGIPYGNTSAGQLSETKFSAQNSRLGLRIDSTVKDTKVLGYVETDFLGNAPANLGVSSNAATMRMRLYFANLRWKRWEFLAGQSWSLLTPNRTGLSPLPSDLFYTMDMDIGYQAGLVWARQPQVRVVYHASDAFTAGLSLENPDQYIGGTNGTAAVTLPTGFNGAEVDSGTATTSPNPLPDIIGKLAYDTKVNGLPWHLEIAVLYRSFKINTYTAGVNPVNLDSTASGYGGSFNFSLELVKNLRFVGNAFTGKGDGRYIFGQATDLVINPPNAAGAYTISPLSSWSTLTGLEWQATPMTTLFGYYSNVGIGKKTARQSNGSYTGYGYVGSLNSQNKSISEYTLGAVQTLWKDPSHGALQVIGQLSYVSRKPWSVPAGAPADAHTSMLFLDLRYLLP